MNYNNGRISKKTQNLLNQKPMIGIQRQRQKGKDGDYRGKRDFKKRKAYNSRESC